LKGLKTEPTASKVVDAFKKEIEKEIILPPLQNASSNIPHEVLLV
jgi:hypothetical protein